MIGKHVSCLLIDKRSDEEIDFHVIFPRDALKSGMALNQSSFDLKTIKEYDTRAIKVMSAELQKNILIMFALSEAERPKKGSARFSLLQQLIQETRMKVSI